MNLFKILSPYNPQSDNYCTECSNSPDLSVAADRNIEENKDKMKPSVEDYSIIVKSQIQQFHHLSHIPEIALGHESFL